MVSKLLLIVITLLGWGRAAHAQATDIAPEDPKNAFGLGFGYPGLIHLDYSHWVATQTSVDLSLTPLLLLNVGTISVTQHIPLSVGPKPNQNLVVAGAGSTLVGIMDGSPAFGLGVRVGYEWLTKGFGFSVTAGQSLWFSASAKQEPFFMFEPRLTMWFVKRES